MSNLTIEQLEFWLESDDLRAVNWRRQNTAVLIEYDKQLKDMRAAKVQAEKDKAAAAYLESFAAAKAQKAAEEKARQDAIDAHTAAIVGKGQKELEQELDPIVQLKRRKAARTW